MSLARADGSAVDVVDILLDLVPAHKRHHFTKAIGEQGRPAVMVSAAAYDDTALRAQIVALEARCSGLAGEVAALRMTLDQVIAGYRQVEADLLQVHHNLASHTHETIRSAAA